MYGPDLPGCDGLHGHPDGDLSWNDGGDNGDRDTLSVTPTP